MLQELRRVCSSGALLEVIIGLDPDRDRSEVERLELQPLSVAYIDSVLTRNYKDAGFQILERGVLPPSEWPKLQTSWSKRLRGGVNRSLVYIIACATPDKMV